MSNGATSAASAASGLMDNNAFGNFTTYPADIDPSLFQNISGLEGDWLGESAFTPAQRFRQFAQRTTAPGSAMRDALYGVSSPLLQQYYLGGLGGSPRFGTQSRLGGSFEDFMRGYTGMGAGTTPNQLRSLAGEIANISAMPAGQGPGSFLDYLAGDRVTPETALQMAGTQQGRTITADEAALYRNLYGEAENAAANRRELANLIALQRPGGGIYGGIVGQSLSGVMNELYDAYTSRNPAGNFLSYFLDRTRPDSDTQGLAQLFQPMDAPV